MPSLRSVALEYNIWWQFKYRKWQEDLYGKKLLESKPCHPATFSHTNPLSISKIKIAPKFNILMLQTSNLAVPPIFSCSFYFCYSRPIEALVHNFIDRNSLLYRPTIVLVTSILPYCMKFYNYYNS